MGVIGRQFKCECVAGALIMPLLYSFYDNYGEAIYFDELTWYINLGIISPVFKPPYTQAIERLFKESNEIWSD